MGQDYDAIQLLRPTNKCNFGGTQNKYSGGILRRLWDRCVYVAIAFALSTLSTLCHNQLPVLNNFFLVC